MPTDIATNNSLYVTSNAAPTESIIASNVLNTADLRTLLGAYIGMPNNERTRSSIYNTIGDYVTNRAGNPHFTDSGTATCRYTLQANVGEATVDNYTINLPAEFTMTPTFDVNEDTTLTHWKYTGNWSNLAATPINITFNHVSDCWDVTPILSPRDAKRQRIRANVFPVVRMRGEGTTPSAHESPEEMMAMEALREVVTEEEFRKYLKYGFVLVKGRSGATYQVYRNRSHVKVWVGGKVVEEICVYLRGLENGKAAPATDKVVAFKAMIEADEEEFKKLGNRYMMAA